MTTGQRITESENPKTSEIDKLGITDALSLINAEDARVATAVGSAIPSIARFLESLLPRMKEGGRLIYIGTGTSGRLGVLDASEIPPTFGVPYGKVVGLIAGGYEALHKAVEVSEDDFNAGATDLESIGIDSLDTVVGIAASGRTPYTIGALVHANRKGCLTACITCVPDSEITKQATHSIVAVVGPEVIAGSTRMKSGTAQKMILNMISTMMMIGLGYVRGNRMTNLRASNEKLRARAVQILMAETSLDEGSARQLLIESDGDLKVALVMEKTGASKERSAQALDQSAQVISEAVRRISNED